MDFYLLGGVRVASDGVDVPLGGPRQRRLLAVLLLGEGRVVGIDRIVEAVWGDGVPPVGATRTVQSYASRLRTALGDGFVSPRAEGYGLDRRDVTVDAERFVAGVRAAAMEPPAAAVRLLDEALGLWHGRAFGEFADEEWCRPAVVRLEEVRVVALETRVQASLDLGAHVEVVPELERLVAEHPLRDRFWAQLMVALFRSGRQADALRAFHRHRGVLADEVGLDPSRELVELERRIAVADPSLAFVTVGRSVRGYVLTEVIGEGEFGAVYRAVQPGVGRDVAVKVVRPELADDPGYVRRFEGEARLVARLEHPHIVPLYDFWREPGAAYLVFRFTRGGTVADDARDGSRWSLGRVNRLVEEIGDALVAAHAAGVVHGDVSSANGVAGRARQRLLVRLRYRRWRRSLATDRVQPDDWGVSLSRRTVRRDGHAGVGSVCAGGHGARTAGRLAPSFGRERGTRRGLRGDARCREALARASGCRGGAWSCHVDGT